MNPLDLFDRPIAFQRSFVKLTGSITGALMLSQAIYWQKRCQREDGWWWKTLDEWGEETGMTRKEVERSRRECRKFLQYKVQGLPPKGHYRVNVGALVEYVQNGQIELPGMDKLNCPERTKQYVQNGQNNPPQTGILHIGETTPEITPETTTGGNVAVAEEIYSIYPKKVAKGKAIEAIQKKLKKFSAEKLLEATSKFAAAWAGVSDLQYCAHPATWFNQERFNDDPSTWVVPRENGKSHVADFGEIKSPELHAKYLKP